VDLRLARLLDADAELAARSDEVCCRRADHEALGAGQHLRPELALPAEPAVAAEQLELRRAFQHHCGTAVEFHLRQSGFQLQSPARQRRADHRGQRRRLPVGIDDARQHRDAGGADELGLTDAVRRRRGVEPRSRNHAEGEHEQDRRREEGRPDPPPNAARPARRGLRCGQRGTLSLRETLEVPQRHAHVEVFDVELLRLGVVREDLIEARGLPFGQLAVAEVAQQFAQLGEAVGGVHGRPSAVNV
jgi:hypothetical protein